MPMMKLANLDTNTTMTFDDYDRIVDYMIAHEGDFHIITVEDDGSVSKTHYVNRKGHVTGPNGFSAYSTKHPTLHISVVDHYRKEVKHFKNIESITNFIRQRGLGMFEIVDNKRSQRCFIERTCTGLYWTAWQKI